MRFLPKGTGRWPRPLRHAVASVPVLTLCLGFMTAAGPAESATATCSATYSTESSWSGGFVGAVTVSNTGTTALTGWTVTFSFGGDQTVTDSWDTSLTQSLEYVTASSLSYNGSVAAGSNTSFGFQGTWSASNAAPASLTCAPASTVTPAIVTSASSLPVMQGFTGTFGVALSMPPAADVTVTVGAAGNTGLSVGSGSTLTFTPTDWNTAQDVTIAADTSSSGATTFTVASAGYLPAAVTGTEIVSTPAPQIHVSGNELADASGGQVVLHGMDRSGSEYACVQGWGFFDGPADEASILAMKNWSHVTAVRVPLNEACWNGESYVDPTYAGQNYINAIKNYVDLLTANGLDVILDLHWTDGLYTGPSSGCSSAEAVCQKPMPDAAEAIPFWTSVANTFKGDNAVIFDLFNEPYASRATGSTTTGWECWLDGGTCPGIGYQVAGMQSMVNAVRSTGATNVLMLGGEEYANDLTDWLQYEPTDPDNNLVASWHSYSGNTCDTLTCWTSEVEPVIESVPVIAGEIGEGDCAGTYIDSLTSWLESENTSFLAWTWDDWANGCASGPTLITDYAGDPTPYGAAYQAILQALP